MNLLVVTVSAPFGPAEAFVAAELGSLRRLGHRVIVAPVRPHGPIIHREFEGATDVVLKASLISPVVLAWFLVEVIRSPRRALAAFALIANSRSASVLAKNLAVLPKALWLARRARREHVAHIHAYWASTPATVGMIAAALIGVAFSFTAHAGDIDEDNLLRFKSRRASVVRVISGDGRRRMLEAGVPERLVHLVHLGVNVPDRPVTRPGIPGRLAVLVPAALHPKKGHIYLLRAIQELATSEPIVEVEARFAGAGPAEEELLSQAMDLGIEERVTFLGHLPHEALLAVYAAGSVDIVSIASVTRGGVEAEGIPVALIEAMAHGIPVVATDSGGVAELVTGETGILVPMRDPAALAAAFRSLALDPTFGNRLARAGRAHIEAEFDVRKTAAELIGALSGEAVGSRHSP